MNARHLTVRNVPQKIAAALDAERRRRGKSLNQTVIEVLEQALGTSAPRSNGLAKLAGTWTDRQLKEFECSIAAFEKVDRDLWR